MNSTVQKNQSLELFEIGRVGLKEFRRNSLEKVLSKVFENVPDQVNFPKKSPRVFRDYMLKELENSEYGNLNVISNFLSDNLKADYVNELNDLYTSNPELFELFIADLEKETGLPLNQFGLKKENLGEFVRGIRRSGNFLQRFGPVEHLLTGVGVKVAEKLPYVGPFAEVLVPKLFLDVRNKLEENFGETIKSSDNRNFCINLGTFNHLYKIPVVELLSSAEFADDLKGYYRSSYGENLVETYESESITSTGLSYLLNAWIPSINEHLPEIIANSKQGENNDNIFGRATKSHLYSMFGSRDKMHLAMDQLRLLGVYYSENAKFLDDRIKTYL